MKRRFSRTVGSVLVNLLFTAFLMQPIFTIFAAECRIGLVIANGAYDQEVGSLTGPYRDANRIADALRLAAFDLVPAPPDQTRAQLEKSIATFAERLRACGDDAVGFFYFAGHGAADRKRGEVYLLPTDARPHRVSDLKNQAVSVDGLLDVAEATGAKAVIVVIDACRNVPLIQDLHASITGDEVGSGRVDSSGEALGGGLTEWRGLTRVDREHAKKRTPTLVAYATEPGNVAADNGAFAEALAAEMTKPGASAKMVFEATKVIVARASKGQQVPRIDNGLVDEIQLVAPDPGRSTLAAFVYETDWADRQASELALERIRNLLATGRSPVTNTAGIEIACDPVAPLVVKRELQQAGYGCKR